ncbi:MAG: hypothetical protein A4S08_04440 [Proteobacteria bacterium SG_bin4]|nr:MAG: hypothetical protein A4S08_04440 [Proteobacteria bacterium SG_bin4]
MHNALTLSFRHLTQSLRLMVGVPDYGAYVKHMKTAHPDRAIMTYEEFFRERQEARYGGKISRCC